jgi:putative SOS response-associated peptidase YedK
MCGRYVSPDEGAMQRAWQVGRQSSNPFTRNFNVAPSTQVPLLRRDSEFGDLELTAARWGLIPVWWKEAKLPVHTINARSAEAATKAMWRHPLRSARCLMPAEGWYEWQKVERVDPGTGEVKEAKQPHYIYRKGTQPFCFAALMSFWTPPGKTDFVLSCSILTRAASPALASVHDRMPVVLPEPAHEAWLDPGLTDAAKVMAIIRECAVDDFHHHAVSTRVNSPKNMDEKLLEPIPA